MSYIVTTTQAFEDIPEGETAEPIERSGQKLYQFNTGNKTYCLLSWQYIQSNKDKFDISRSNK